MTPFSNFKGSAAEGRVRAPFVIRYPGHIIEGGRSSAFSYVLDVVPTLLEFIGVKPGDAALLGGKSMVSLIEGASMQVHTPSEPVGYEAAGGAAVYRGDDKLVRSAPPYDDGIWRLYNLSQDPTESHDLAPSEPALMQSMLADCAAYVKKNGVIEVPAGYDVIKQAQANAAKTN